MMFLVHEGCNALCCVARQGAIGSADLAFKVPMLANLPVDDVGISVKAAVSDFAQFHAD